jgi:hypothetical protein
MLIINYYYTPPSPLLQTHLRVQPQHHSKARTEKVLHMGVTALPGNEIMVHYCQQGAMLRLDIADQ